MELVRGLEITLIGMVGVFATLVLLQGVVILTGLLVKLFSKPKAETHEPAANTSAPLAADSGIPREHLAAIAAAVAMLGQSYRIRTIEAVSPVNWERCRYTDINSF